MKKLTIFLILLLLSMILFAQKQPLLLKNNTTQISVRDTHCFKLYPNPVVNLLTIELDTANFNKTKLNTNQLIKFYHTIQIYDVMGKTVYDNNIILNDNKYTINFYNLMSGMYVIIINHKYKYKILKVKN